MYYVGDRCTGRRAVDPLGPLRALSRVGLRPRGERWDEALVSEIGERAFQYPDRPMGAVEWDPVARIVGRVHDRLFKALANGRPAARPPARAWSPGVSCRRG